jgi:hypothetical protein
MDSPVVITHIDKNANEKVRVALDIFHDVRLIDVRVTVALTGTCDVQTPTKRGVSLRVEQLPALIAALIQADFKAKELGWTGGGA